LVFDTAFTQNIAVGFTNVNDTTGAIELQVKESARMVPFVALKVYLFPHINVLWIGTIVMVTGFFMSLLYRRKLNKRQLPTT
jgi:cytochrome c-type biogenesis protein CcmF